MFKTIRSQQFKKTDADIKVSRDSKDYAALVPNAELLDMEKKLKRNGKWNHNSFATDFLPAYINQLKTQDGRDALNDLFKKSKAGTEILLANHSNGNAYDWSTVIIGLMQGAGADTTSENQLGFFYDAYKQPTEATAIVMSHEM